MTKLPRGKIVGQEPENEAEHSRKCEKCGALYDMRDLEAVFAARWAVTAPRRCEALSFRL
jgi:methionyl-tRNA synthetase